MQLVRSGIFFFSSFVLEEDLIQASSWGGGVGFGDWVVVGLQDLRAFVT